MARKVKLGTLRGVSQWKALETPGDVRRFLAWCIHSIRDQSIDPKVAAIMAQIGAFALRAVELDTLARDVAEIKKRLDQQDAVGTQNGTVAH